MEKRGRKIEIERIEAEEMIQKIPRAHGNGARVMAPKHWIGKPILMILLKEDKFPNYMISEGMRLIKLVESGEVKSDDVMLLDNMLSVSNTLGNLEDTMISEETQKEMDTVIRKLDTILIREGYCQTADNINEDDGFPEASLEDLYGPEK